MPAYWREEFARRIADVLAAHPKATERERMDLLWATCPRDPDAVWVRKIWRKELHVALRLAKRGKGTIQGNIKSSIKLSR